MLSDTRQSRITLPSHQQTWAAGKFAFSRQESSVAFNSACACPASALQSERLLAETARVLQPKDWSIRMNKKERRLAMGTALQSANANITIVEDLKVGFDKDHIGIGNLQSWPLHANRGSYPYS